MNDREKLIALFKEFFGNSYSAFVIEIFAKKLIANGVVVREKGEWIPYDYDICGYRNVGERCSRCGYEICQVKSGVYHFCANCGADMRRRKNDG